MKLIIDKGINNIFSRILIIRNGKEKTIFPTDCDYCEFPIEKNNILDISLKTRISGTIPLTSISYSQEKNIIYIRPSTLYKVWESVNFKWLPYLCIILLVLGISIDNSIYEWVCAVMIALTAISLMTMQFGQWIPSIRKKLFHATWL